MGKTKESFIALQEQMYENAKVQRHGLDEAHWNHCAELVGELIEATEIAEQREERYQWYRDTVKDADKFMKEHGIGGKK